MSDNRSTLRELIELIELKEVKELLQKKEEKKPPPKWWALNPIKLYIILVLSYPLIGPLYYKLIIALWK